MEATTERRSPTRTCVGCGRADAASELVRVVLTDVRGPTDGEAVPPVAFDLAGGSMGRGAHVHPRTACLTSAPRGLSRSFRRDVRVSAEDLGRSLVGSCQRRIAGLLLSARRLGDVAIGDAALEALRAAAPLGIVASDAGVVATSREVLSAVAEGRVVAWSDKNGLGALLGGGAVAICAVRHEAIAAEIKKTRLAADAGAATTREGAECSRRPEAR